MMPINPIVLGVVLLLVGAIFIFLVWVFVRFVPKMRSRRQAAKRTPAHAEESASGNAVIVVQAGGRVDYVNATTTEWFALKGGERASLEVLAKRIHPSEEFLKICAREGRARFSLSGRPVEGFSYRIPGSVPAILVAMNRPGISTNIESGEAGTLPTLRILTDFNEAIFAVPDFRTTMRAILEYIEQLIPVESLTIKMLDSDQEGLVPYNLLPATKEGRQLTSGPIELPGGFSDLLLETQKPIFLADTQSQEEELRSLAEDKGFRSFIGTPLVVKDENIGTLEAGLSSAEAYSTEDFEMVKLIAPSVAAALRNTHLLEKEQQRSIELSGMAELARALGSAHESSELFPQLVESLSPLFDVKILGFLIYNENKRILEAQVPFMGMPEPVVGLYHVPLAAGSRVEESFLKKELLTTRNAAEDETWRDMGFQDYALAASWRDTALIPLVSSGTILGYLQISNHNNPEEAFNAEEMRLLNLVANQTAPIIENYLLVAQAREREQRSETLGRIVSLATSPATKDEVLKNSVEELARLLQAEVAAIYLVDESRGELRLHETSLFGLDEQGAEALRQMFADETQVQFSATGSRHSFMTGHLAVDQNLLAVYGLLEEKLRMQSVILVPLIVRGRSLGELMLGSRQINHFNATDPQIVSTAAGQLATSLEGIALSSQTDESLRKLVEQLSAMARIGRELNTTSEGKQVLQLVYDEALRTTRADCGTILLFGLDEKQKSKEKHEVIFHLGEPPGNELLPIERKALKSGDPVVVESYEKEGDSPAHEGIHSALVVPIAYQHRTAGLIHLHSSVPGKFDPSAVDTIQTLAVQAAIALGNAQRFQEQVRRNQLLNHRADTLSKLFDTTTALTAENPLEQSLEALAKGIQESTPFKVVLISMIEPETLIQRRVTGVGITQETLNQLKEHSQSWQAVEKLLRPEFKVGQGYFIPFDQRPWVSDKVQIVQVIEEEVEKEANAWNPEDSLLYPLLDHEGTPVGLISLDAPQDGLRPDPTTLETLELFAAQVALVIASARQLEEYRQKAESLASSLDRQHEVTSISQSQLPTLLHKDLEQIISIRNLERRAHHIRAGLEITETVNRQVDAPSALVALGREILTRLDMSASVVAENSQEGPRMLHALGNIPRGISPEALFGQRNPLRTTLQTGETLLVMNLDQDDTWRNAPLLNSLHAKAFICLPIVVQEQPIAGVLAVSPEPLPPLSEEDRQVYFQISRQVSIIIQNIRLLTETRRRLREVNLLLDFSRQLSGLDSGDILKALLESALRVVSAAHAGAVLLFDPSLDLLVPRTASGYADVTSLMQITYKPGVSLPGKVYAERKSHRVDEVNFARDYVLPAEFLLRYREATAGRLPVSSLLLPIQTGDQHLGVLVLDNFNTPAAFSPDDEALLLSLTQQVALSLENVRLAQASQQRTMQLQALTNVSATMTSSLESGELVDSMLDRLHEVLPYDTAILWLREGEQMKVAAARGFPDNEERVGLSVAIEDSRLLAEMSRTSQGIVVGDVSADDRFPALIQPERFSWMGIPLVSKEEVIGVIALEKVESFYFTLDLRQLVTTYASQAAVALENARLYEESLRRATELDERSQRMALLNRLSGELSGSLSEEDILELTAAELHRALSAQKVYMVAFTPTGNPVLRAAAPSGSKISSRLLPPAAIFDRLRESLGVFSTDNIHNEPDLAPLIEFLPKATSVVILPLASGQSLRALAIMQMARGYRSTPVEIELARTICNQAAVALESARLYQATVSRAEQMLTINRASYEIGLSLDPEEIYTAIHRATEQLMTVESFAISLLDEENNEIEGVYLMDPSGRAPNQRIPVGQGISGKVIASGEAVLVPDALAKETGGITYGEGRPRSILAVPLAIGGRVIGMLSAQSYQPNIYSDEDKQILSTLANQAAVALQNGRLFDETRRLAEELEQRVIERTAELSREQRSTETLLRILTEASSTLDLDRALNRTLALLNEAIGSEQASVLMVDEKDSTINYRAGYGYLTPMMTEGSRPTKLKSGEGLAGWIINNRQSVCIDDVRTDERWKKMPTNTANHRSVVGAPLMVGEDAIGAIMAFHRDSKFFTPEHLNLVQAIGSQVAVAVNNAKLYELIRNQAERLGTMFRNEQVEASRQQAILEAVADGVLVTDSDNHITFVNPSTERLLKVNALSILEQPLEKFVGIFGAAAQTWMETIRAWSENPTSPELSETYAEQLELEKGRVILVHLAPVIWRDEFLGTVSTFRDISHEVEVDRLKSEFVATVSHELRTPMTSIKGYVDLLLMGAAGALNENQTHFLDIVHTNTDRLSSLVNELLDISRIEAGRVSLTIEDIDLRAVVDDVTADIRRRTEEEKKPMEVIVDAPKDLPPIRGDLERIRQIVGNVVDNAFNYTPANGKINIVLRKVDGMVQVDVEDSGIGISPANAERVFERFYRGEDPLVLATPGTGLGLAIVKELVLMHNGNIWMESKGIPGEGSKFSITLPLNETGSEE